MRPRPGSGPNPLAVQLAAPHTLLSIEDNVANLRLVEQLVGRRRDLVIRSADNAVSGIQIARDIEPTVILMDINLFGIKRFQALAMLRIDAALSHIPVLAITANAMMGDRVKGLEAGFFRYLTKPIIISEFMEALDGAMEFARSRPAVRPRSQATMISATDILQSKILIVDDREANVMLLEKVLRGAGYLSIASTRDPTQVFQLHLVHRFDLILLDLEMPGMDGFEVMERLKEIELDGMLPVLVVTAQPDHKVLALKAGARDFVSKPFALSEVLARVHNMLEARLLHVETKRLYDRLVAEREVSHRLLLSMSPRAIAERLHQRPALADEEAAAVVTASYAEVTLIFDDIISFTHFAEGTSAAVLYAVLGEIGDRFDELQGLRPATPDPEPSRTAALDAAFLAAADVPDALANNSLTAASRAIDLSAALARFNGQSRYKLHVQIGVEATAKVRKGSRRRTKLYPL